MILERVLKLRFVMLAALSLLVVRVAYLSVYQGERLARQAVVQRTESISVKAARGVIYDRNMLKITEGQSRLYAAVVPSECEDITEISRLTGQTFDTDEVKIFPLTAVTENQASLVGMRGVSLFNVSERYNGSGILSHVIGYTSDNGGFGIERVFDRALKSGQDDSISMIKNANQTIMSGLGYAKTAERSRRGVKLTIDYHIQEVVEKAMDEGVTDGAAVVVEVKSGEIVAMASRPGFKQPELAKYLGSDRGELINRAICAYDVGSVFKLVLTVSALEEGIFRPQSQFFCGGKLDVSGREFVCNDLDGHGTLTLSQGLAQSCNVVFYRVGQAVGMASIEKYAKALGFGKQVLSILDYGEADGFIPPAKGMSPQELANVSIGQGNISVTPVQVADMLCTIANGGVRKQLRLVKGIVDDNGQSQDTEPVMLGRVFSEKTASEVQKMLCEVVAHGTGSRARIEEWGSAGKTGSAETGWERDGELMTHGWFAGYFPAEAPQYVCVVLVENGKSGGRSAAPVFAEIGEGIKALGQ